MNAKIIDFATTAAIEHLCHFAQTDEAPDEEPCEGLWQSFCEEFYGAVPADLRNDNAVVKDTRSKQWSTVCAIYGSVIRAACAKGVAKVLETECHAHYPHHNVSDSPQIFQDCDTGETILTFDREQVQSNEEC